MDESKRSNKRKLGEQGEKFATVFLQKKGYTILETNFRYGRLGEIDIITSKDEYICFVEVKTRTGMAFGMPSEAVGYEKQSNIRKLSWVYLKQCSLTSKAIRFDVIEVTGIIKDGRLECIKINHIENAF